MSTTQVWQEYERGIDYKTRIGLYHNVDLNERFFAGDQWAGIPHEGLPTPVVNFIRYATAWKIAAVTDRRLMMRFLAEGEDDGGDISIYARQISGFCDVLWERLKMDYLTKEGLKQAAITGDYLQYFYWDPSLETGQAATGDIATQLIDNVNYYPGNPSSPDVQSQQSIIIAFRELVEKVKEEAKQNGCENVDDIVADEDNEYTSGDRGKVELSEAGKCNVLLKMVKKDGRVWCEKAVRRAVVQPLKDTGLKRYPLALMNWDTRKNSCHGVAEVTGLIPNQVFVNKILALSQLSQMQMSFPKVVYDRTRIREWTNKVAGAIAVNGDISGAAQYLSLPGAGYDAWQGLNATLETTMRMMGANDVTLGNIRNPDNTSAFIATRDAALVPLQAQQERFYSFVEDVGLVWLDFIQQYYKAGRRIPVELEGKRVFVPIPDEVLDPYTLRLKLDVGPSSMWSEVQTLQTLDNLLKGGKLTLKQYLERIPDGHIPRKAELLAEVEQAPGGGAPGMPGMLPGGQAAPLQGGPMPPGATPAGAPMQGKPIQPQGQPQGDIGAVLKQLQGGGPPQAGGIPQGMNPGVPQGDMAAILSRLQAGDPRPPLQRGNAPTTGGQPGMPQSGLEALIQRVHEGAQFGKVPPKTLKAVEAVAAQAHDAGAVLEALESAAARGQADKAFVAQLRADFGGSAGMMPKAQPGGMPLDGTIPKPVQAGGSQGDDVAALMARMRAGANAGTVPQGIVQALEALAAQGADAAAIHEAVGNAAAQGLIPKEVLGGAAAPAVKKRRRR